jgi:hypothetical protein
MGGVRSVEVAPMCYERWKSQRERADEEARRMWDLFNEETAGEAPRPLSEDEPEIEAPEPTISERATAGRER